MKIASIFFCGKEVVIYEKGGKYYKRIDNYEKPVTKLFLANLIGGAKSFNLDTVKIVKKRKSYIAKKYFIVYDLYDIELLAYANEKSEAISKIEEIYKNLIDLYNKYQANQERNMRNFMRKIHKFAYFDDKIHYFEDNDKDFRELLMENGIPNDARADASIRGYVYDDNLVIFKVLFLGDDKKKFLDFIQKNKNEIAKHYGLKSFKLYKGVLPCWRKFVDENNCLLDELTHIDFDYYTPDSYEEEYTVA